MEQPSQRTSACIRAYINLMRSAESVVGRVNLPLLQDRLTVSQFGVLEALVHLGPMSQKDLSTKILKSHGNISVVVDNLEKRGLVVRTRGAVEDRRVVMVSLTSEGAALVESVLPGTVDRIEHEMGVLSDDELETLRSICRKLGLRLGGASAGDGATAS